MLRRHRQQIGGKGTSLNLTVEFAGQLDGGCCIIIYCFANQLLLKQAHHLASTFHVARIPLTIYILAPDYEIV